MAIKESEFSKSQLWPSSNFRWMAPGAVQSVQSKYGPGLDLGALKVIKGIWHILWSSTPTGTSSVESMWVPFEFSNDQHRTAANAFNRYGVGWSYGPAHNMHNEVYGYYFEVYGRHPTKMEQMDIEHSQIMWNKLVKDYQIKIGFEPGKPVEPKPKPTDPNPKPVPVDPVPQPAPTTTLTLSTPEQRTQELLSLIPFRDMILPRFIIESLPKAILELVKAKRRMEERLEQRIAQRVVEEIKKLK